jgi:hypothetical protein
VCPLSRRPPSGVHHRTDERAHDGPAGHRRRERDGAADAFGVQSVVFLFNPAILSRLGDLRLVHRRKGLETPERPEAVLQKPPPPSQDLTILSHAVA